MKTMVGDADGNTVSCQKQRMLIKERSLRTMPGRMKQGFLSTGSMTGTNVQPPNGVALEGSTCMGHKIW